jgi:hypothetical protein
MTDQPALFDTPEPERLALPTSASPARSAVIYLDITTRRRCEDCEVLVYEALMAGQPSGHHIRIAQIKRTEACVSVLLCHAHAQERRMLDAHPRRTT